MYLRCDYVSTVGQEEGSPVLYTKYASGGSKNLSRLIHRILCSGRNVTMGSISLWRMNGLAIGHSCSSVVQRLSSSTILGKELDREPIRVVVNPVS